MERVRPARGLCQGRAELLPRSRRTFGSRMSFANSGRHCSGSCAAKMAASADAPPYGLGSPDPLSRGPLPGVAGEVTEATEAGLSTTDRVVGVTVKAMSLREVNPVEVASAGARLRVRRVSV